ncbi:MAG: hypothetical protein V3V56_11605 [bacterium]
MRGLRKGATALAAPPAGSLASALALAGSLVAATLALPSGADAGHEDPGGKERGAYVHGQRREIEDERVFLCGDKNLALLIANSYNRIFQKYFGEGISKAAEYREFNAFVRRTVYEDGLCSFEEDMAHTSAETILDAHRTDTGGHGPGYSVVRAALHPKGGKDRPGYIITLEGVPPLR